MLSFDILDELARCPACLGGATFTAKLVRCLDCRRTGFTPQLHDFQLFVDEKLENFPARNKTEQSWTVEWTCSRREILEGALKILG